MSTFLTTIKDEPAGQGPGIRISFARFAATSSSILHSPLCMLARQDVGPHGILEHAVDVEKASCDGSSACIVVDR